MELRGTCLAVFGLILFSSPVLAQDFEEPRQTEVNTIESTPLNELADRTTTQPVYRIPEKRALLKEQQSIFGLNNVPGLQVRERGNPTISIRGSQSSARVMSLIDDVPANFANGAGLYPLFVPTETIKSIGVLKGPGSHLWGHDALAGALLFTTEDYDRPLWRTRFASTKHHSLFAATPITTRHDPNDAQLTAFYESDPGFRARSNRETLRATLKGDADWGSVKLKTNHIIAREIGSTPASTDGIYTPSTFNNDGSLSGLTARVEVANGVEFGSRTSYRRISTDYGAFGKNDASTTSQGLSLFFTAEDLQIETFVDSSHDNYKASFLQGEKTSRTLTEGGAVALFSAGPQANVHVGARSSSEGGGVLLSVGYNTLLESDWLVFANYSDGYHPPSLSQKFEQSAFFIPNPELKPERSPQVDLGMERAWNVSKFSMQIFQRETRDLIGTAEASPGIRTYRNVNKALATGFEADYFTQFRAFESMLSLGYLKNRSVDPEGPLPLSPEIQASLQIAGNLNRWKLTFQETYWSETEEFGRKLKPWYSTDFLIGYQWDERILTKLSFLNLFNQHRELTAGFPEPGMQYFVTVQGTL